MGTKAVPTAELELCGASGYLIGEPNSGVKVISAILNITRIHNAVNSVACIRRSIAVARDYASRRKVFGALLSETPLHLQTLADLECEYRGALAMTLEVVVLLGKTECGTATETDNVLLRLLTPLLKLYTGKQSVAVASEAIESLGGTGYMEDSDMPRLLRDTQVTSIWEGTTNVLSMDVWRPIQKENALPIFIKVVKSKLATVGRSGNQDLAVAVDAVQKVCTVLCSANHCLALMLTFTFHTGFGYRCCLC
jgi:alkylation response protein AidB-like acyl-CoA dehydrogenase